MIKKAAYFSNPFIGLFFSANDNFCLMPHDTPNKLKVMIEEALGITPIITTINLSNLDGIYAVMLKDAVLLPSSTDELEIKTIKDHGLDVLLFNSKWNALSNNIALNAKAALINPRFSDEEKKQLSDLLGIEVFSHKLNNYSTIGSLLYVTDKGFVAAYDINDEEFGMLKSIFGVYGIKGSVNLSSKFIGIGMVANNKGAVVGNLTTGIEIARITEGLDLA